ncbi:MAG: ATP-binding protein [Haliscomenobacter sp.]|nr:ATP-binding protein [Haliscomenobacter sp.]
MQNQEFIVLLSHSNSNYNNPEQAITTANLCETISRDINTDSQRFIYELLQNADDASSEIGMLDVRIDFVGDYVVVSHKGELFSKIDIESISSAGDGTKAGDSTKTGFKGIGFKSVFSHSNFVIIKSGNFCFKYDKQYWVNHWNNAWGSQSAWKAEREAKNKDESLKMPWQIIPIWTELPNELNSLPIFQEYSVSTIIRYDKVEELKKALYDLFSESQIILFLRSKQVKVSINANEKIVLEKYVSSEVTTLKRNGSTLSEWLIRTEQFPIPSNVQTEVNADDKSPKKLKEAQQTEISFAIQVDKGKLKAVEKKTD